MSTEQLKLAYLWHIDRESYCVVAYDRGKPESLKRLQILKRPNEGPWDKWWENTIWNARPVGRTKKLILATLPKPLGDYHFVPCCSQCIHKMTCLLKPKAKVTFELANEL